MCKKIYIMPKLRIKSFEIVRTIGQSNPLITAKYDAQVSYTQIKAKVQTQNTEAEVK